MARIFSKEVILNCTKYNVYTTQVKYLKDKN